MVGENNRKKNLSKLADMVKNNTALCRRQSNISYDIEDRDIRELASLVKRSSNMNVPRTAFSVRQIRSHQRFGYNKYIFDVNVGSENMRTLPDFLINLRKVFEYLINTMKYYAESDTSKARFYISNAPHTPFSTAILNVSDFTTDMFFNIFERQMQSNAQEIINNGWRTNVSLYIFPNSYTPRQSKKNTKKTPSLYKYFRKASDEAGSGKKNDVAIKHGHEVRHGVFQIGKGSVKNSCLALVLLVGRSYLKNDTTDDDITNVYKTSGISVGPVRIDQLQLVYENYLKPTVLI